MPSAKKFKRWVTSEVLPEIRKTGGYGGFQTKRLMEVAEQLAQTSVTLLQATSSIARSVDRLTGTVTVLAETMDKTCIREGSGKLEAAQGECRNLIEDQNCFGLGKCKIELFPAKMRDMVDNMLDDMVAEQRLNFSMIARYCTVNGHPISQPSVRRYYQKFYESENIWEGSGMQ